MYVSSRNGTLTEEVQLGYVLEAFGLAHHMGVGWTTATLLHLKAAGMNSISDLATGCKDRTVNLDLELFGSPPENRFSTTDIRKLNSFLPGPVGHRCFRLAQHISRQVENGKVQSEYVHRQDGNGGKEQWTLKHGDQWVVNVDCAGFVRNALKHVTKNPFVMALSDRDFMRAKDFFDFFSTIPFTVMDLNPIPEKIRVMKWRVVPDLRYVTPGDIICYRPRGSAAGGSAFTSYDHKDLHNLLKAVRTAQLWHEIRDTGALVTKNVARDGRVLPWVQQVKDKLVLIDIFTHKDLYDSLSTANSKLRKRGKKTFKPRTLHLIRECCETRSNNTGHIVFASGPAKYVGGNEYRVRVIQSTKYGKKDADGKFIKGVQEYYRRFKLVEGDDGTTYWTRDKMRLATKKLVGEPTNEDEVDDEDENRDDEVEDDQPPDDEEDEPESSNPNSGEVHGDLHGGGSDRTVQSGIEVEVIRASHIEVIAARMCF